MDLRLVQVAHGPRQKTQKTVICDAAKHQHEPSVGLQVRVLLLCRLDVALKYRRQSQATLGELTKLTTNGIW